MAGGVARLDVQRKTVCSLVIVGSGTGQGNLAVRVDREIVFTAPSDDLVAGDPDVVAGRCDAYHSTQGLVLGVAESLAGSDHRGGLINIDHIQGDGLGC